VYLATANASIVRAALNHAAAKNLALKTKKKTPNSDKSRAGAQRRTSNAQ